MNAAAVIVAATLARYLMGTVCEIEAEKTEQIEAAFAEAKRVEAMLSTWTDESELSRVNRGADPSPELRALLDTTMDWSARTERAFDPRIRDLVVRHGGRASRPLAAAVPAGADDEPSSETLAGRGRDARPPQFEEGAFGKGYALDRMLALIDGDAMINFGGQIIVRGSREVAIADPTDRDQPVLTLTLSDASLSTSAGSHILDPRTGQAMSEWGSVSVIRKNALTADILSTALYVMGESDGLRWAAANDVAAIFIDRNQTIRLSPVARDLDVAVIDRDFSIKD